MENPLRQDLAWLAKVLVLAGALSVGIKLLGRSVTLTTPPVWVPVTVVLGTMLGAVVILTWLVWRDTHRPASTHRSSGDAAHRQHPPPETTD